MIDWAVFNILVALWFLLPAVMLLLDRWQGRGSSGLCTAYLGLTWIAYFPGALLLYVDWYWYYPTSMVYEGFVMSSIGLLAFFLGALLPIGLVRRQRADDAIAKGAVATHELERVGWYVAAYGITISLTLFPLVWGIASITAVFSWFAQLGVVGMILVFFARARHTGKALWPLLGLLLVFPALTMLSQGFLGYGIAAMVTVGAFVLSLYRPQVWWPALALVGLYFFLSVFVTYMRDRDTLREAVWSGAALEQRLDVVEGAVTEFEWFDVSDGRHLHTIDSRLNQNWLVGATIENIRRAPQYALDGESVYAALVAWIPRAVWPDKPKVGGGGDLVARVSGLDFSRETSIGAGQILEFYGNFKTAGVIIGMFLYGFLLRILDRKSRSAIDHNDPFRFVIWYLPGMAFLQPGGNLAEVASGAPAALIAAASVRLVLERWLRPELLKAPETRGPL